MPQFDEESDPKEFLLKYEAMIEATGGGSACKAKTLVLTLKGLAQQWYTNLPNVYIYSWDQLRTELSTCFRAVRPDEVTSCDFHDIKQGSLSLQEYLQRIVNLRARALEVAEQSIIDATVRSLNMDPCDK